jgi:hypothetical protein
MAMRESSARGKTAADASAPEWTDMQVLISGLAVAVLLAALFTFVVSSMGT